jgi:signal transduction histidine kinase
LEEGIVKASMKEKDIKVALQLSVSENKIGVLFLGEKETGEIYSSQDIGIFEILAPELSIAIRNSQAYEEIKRFNITLQQEVNRATKELKDANEKLKALDKLKDEFVSLASHELRTPMTAIKSYLWMAIAGKGGELTEKQKYYLDRAYTSTDRLIKLVNEMLNVSRIESGRIILEQKEVDINKLTDDVVADVLPRAQELGITLENHHISENIHVYIDENKIKEVFINLIGNSLKFTPKGGKIIISSSKKESTIEVSVTDTGKGLAPQDLSKLFQKFGKVDNDYLTVQNVQGTGLGLYISKAIVELHKGSMWVHSDGLSKGATFTFSLPIHSPTSLPQ